MKLSKKISDSIELKFSKIARSMNMKKQISYSLGLESQIIKLQNLLSMRLINQSKKD